MSTDKMFCMLCHDSQKFPLHELTVRWGSPPSTGRYCNECLPTVRKKILEKLESKADEAESEVSYLQGRLDILEEDLSYEEDNQASLLEAAAVDLRDAVKVQRAARLELKDAVKLHKARLSAAEKERKKAAVKYTTAKEKSKYILAELRASRDSRKEDLKDAERECDFHADAKAEFVSQASACNSSPRNAQATDPSGTAPQSEAMQSQKSPHSLRETSSQVVEDEGQAPSHYRSESEDILDGADVAHKQRSEDEISVASSSPVVDAQANRGTDEALQGNAMEWTINERGRHDGDLEDDADQDADEGTAKGGQGDAAKHREDRKTIGPTDRVRQGHGLGFRGTKHGTRRTNPKWTPDEDEVLKKLIYNHSYVGYSGYRCIHWWNVHRAFSYKFQEDRGIPKLKYRWSKLSQSGAA